MTTQLFSQKRANVVATFVVKHPVNVGIYQHFIYHDLDVDQQLIYQSVCVEDRKSVV